MVTEPLESRYFNWLCAKVMYVENSTPSLTYWKLLRELFNTEFVWVVPRDHNRAEDGTDLRIEFLRSLSSSDEGFDPHVGCSMLEMLIGFARRAEFETGDSECEWFWRFIDTLHLSQFNDANFDAVRVGDILDKLIWRTYNYSGKNGGLFPLEHPKRDQRKLEIWYQFCDYVAENKLVV